MSDTAVVDKQLSFGAGEVTPALYGRPDLQKFDSACRTLLNTFVHVQGGASNRPGLEFIGAVHDSSKITRQIKFRFNTAQTYILEFSDYVFRVIKDQAYVLNDPVTITAITKADPAVVTIGAHSLIVGQEVFIDPGDMTELNKGTYRIKAIAATTISLEDIFGTSIDSTSFTTYTAGGTVESVPVFVTPFAETDLALIKFTQNADVLTLTHPDWAFMYNISRSAHDVWTVEEVSFIPGIAAPINFSVVADPFGGVTVLRAYVVTAIDDTTGEESVASSRVVLGNDLSIADRRNNLTWTPVANATKYNAYCDDNLSGVYGFVGESTQIEETVTMTAATQANPCVITIGTHQYEIGQQVDISGVVGMTELNGNTYLVNAVTGTTTISLKTVAGVPVDSTGYTAYVSGGTVIMSLIAEFSDNFITPDYTKTPPETATPFAQTVTAEETITAISQADPCEVTIGSHSYVVDQQADMASIAGMVELNDNTYLINSVTATTITLKSVIGVPVDSTGFTAYTSGGTATISTMGDAPRCVTYHQQRRAYAGPDNKPSTFFASKIGFFNNMNVSQITQDDDAITYNIVAGDVNEIRDMLSQKDLFLFTSSGVWRIKTGDTLVFAANNISAEEQESWGVSNVRALKIGQSFLYIQDGERIVRDLQDTLESNGFAGDELTLLAGHMFKTRKIVSWAYAKYPDSIVWCVMDDGTVNALSYLRKHQIWAWSHHTTDGLFKDVETIQEGTREYGVYFVVERIIPGTTGSNSTMKYIERLHNRDLLDIKDSFFVDSGLSLDSPVAITGATQANPVVITAPLHGFSDADLIDHSDITGMTELNGMRYKIANKTANTYELTDIDDNNIDGSAYTEYTGSGKARLAVTTISGLDHLEGKTVSIFADGGTDANPNNPEFPLKTVIDGSITLDEPASRIHIGLPYISDLETIGVDLTSVNGLGNSLGRIKTTHTVNIRVQDTIGISLGPTEHELEPYKPEGVIANQGQAFINDVISKSFLPVWDRDATVFIRQLEPAPMTVLNILPEVKVVKNG